MTKERIEELKAHALGSVLIHPHLVRGDNLIECLKEIERLQQIERAAKECPYKWRLKCCGMWTDIEKDVCFCCNCGDSTRTEKVLP